MKMRIKSSSLPSYTIVIDTPWACYGLKTTVKILEKTPKKKKSQIITQKYFVILMKKQYNQQYDPPPKTRLLPPTVMFFPNSCNLTPASRKKSSTCHFYGVSIFHGISHKKFFESVSVLKEDTTTDVIW